MDRGHQTADVESSAIFVTVGVIVIVLLCICCGGIWWDLLDCSGYIKEVRQRRRIKKLLKEAAADAEALANAIVEGEEVMNFKDMEIEQITLPLKSSKDQQQEEPQIAFLVKSKH